MLDTNDLENIRLIVRDELKQSKTKPRKASKIIPGMKETWLKYWKDKYDFGVMDNKALVLLQGKLQKASPKDPVELFKHMLQLMPEWYKDKSLPIINSKYNDIIKQIKRTNTSESTQSVKDYFETKLRNNH